MKILMNFKDLNNNEHLMEIDTEKMTPEELEKEWNELLDIVGDIDNLENNWIKIIGLNLDKVNDVSLLNFFFNYVVDKLVEEEFDILLDDLNMLENKYGLYFINEFEKFYEETKEVLFLFHSFISKIKEEDT